MTAKSIQPSLHELKAAHQIIRNTMNLMTPEQKSAWEFINELESCDGDGVTRANEHEAELKRGEV